MHILIEGHHYEPEQLRKLLQGSDINSNQVCDNGHLMEYVDYVGYFYNKDIDDCVMVLPKVLVDEAGHMINENYTPEDFVSLDNKGDEQRCKVEKELKEFVYGFSVWIYRAISVFRDYNPDTTICRLPPTSMMGRGPRRDRYTFLDILLELIEFNKENQDFIMFSLRNMHRGLNKINWTKTISKSQAFIQDDTPIYLNPVNRKRQVDYDEELFVLYYSILNHIHEKYGFPVKINVNFELIKGALFENYLNGMGTTRLRQIKYRYFSDKALRMWELCYAFFDEQYRVGINLDKKDYLLVKNFETVFEDIIDHLIGDPELEKMKKQDDGKILDHIYKYKALTDYRDDWNETNEVHYIGDSKYYKRGASIGDYSLTKQYGYAHNLIQWNLNLFNADPNRTDERRLMDQYTEGYDIIPNFFISARVDSIDKSKYGDSSITHIMNGGTYFHVNKQYENRLFDRDTILISHYDVNFLFVLSLYARNNSGEKAIWKERVHEQFRREIRKGLNEVYDFYALSPIDKTDARQYVKQNFQSVLGRIYDPFGEESLLSLAVDKADPLGENEHLRNELEQHFVVVPCNLGDDPTEALDEKMAAVGARPSAGLSKNGVALVMLENFNTRAKDFQHGKVAIGVKMTESEMALLENIPNIGHVLFHTRNSSENKHLFKVIGTAKALPRALAENQGYCLIPATAELYVCVEIDMGQELDATALNPAVENIPYNGKEERYDPQYATLESLMRQDEHKD